MRELAINESQLVSGAAGYGCVLNVTLGGLGMLGGMMISLLEPLTAVDINGRIHAGVTTVQVSRSFPLAFAGMFLGGSLGYGLSQFIQKSVNYYSAKNTDIYQR